MSEILVVGLIGFLLGVIVGFLFWYQDFLRWKRHQDIIKALSNKYPENFKRMDTIEGREDYLVSQTSGKEHLQ